MKIYEKRGKWYRQEEGKDLQVFETEEAATMGFTVPEDGVETSEELVVEILKELNDVSDDNWLQGDIDED